MEPAPTFQLPSSEDEGAADPFEVLEVLEVEEVEEVEDLGSSSLAGAGPSMKWM
jgi:hypothetical protein